MKTNFKPTLEPLAIKNKTYISSKFFSPYWDLLQSIEFKFHYQGDTYLYLCKTSIIDQIFDLIAEFQEPQLCSLIIQYLSHYRDLEEAFRTWYLISDKHTFVQNLGMIDKRHLENEVKTVIYQLIDLIDDSKDNDLFIQYG